jgi:acetoin utilization deacetylase AcuC-like enzyme
MAARVRDLGRELSAPILVCLEGGYERDALADSVLATVEALAGDDPPPAVEPAPLVADAVTRVASIDRWHGAF